MVKYKALGTFKPLLTTSDSILYKSFKLGDETEHQRLPQDT